jgi:hypothetical protein
MNKLKDIIALETSEVESVYQVQGVPIPVGVRFVDILVTGPFGSGKTTMVETIGGWSGETYVDLAAVNWWRNRLLFSKPREIHFGIPFVGNPAPVSGSWPDKPIDEDRIQLPGYKTRFYHTNWRSRFVFDIQIPSAETIYARRRGRAERGTHPVDADLSFDSIAAEVSAYTAIALHLHKNGFRVFVRSTIMGQPRTFNHQVL